MKKTSFRISKLMTVAASVALLLTGCATSRDTARNRAQKGAGTPRGEWRYLSDLTPTSVSVGYGKLALDYAPCGKQGWPTKEEGLPLKLGEAVFSKGLFAHAPSTINYALDKQFSQFSAVIGLSAYLQTKGHNCTDDRPSEINAVFIVEVDGKEVLRRNMNALDPPETVRVDLSNARVLSLRTLPEGVRGIDSRHTVWADAKLR